LNVTLTVWVVPTAADTCEVLEVAVTVSSVPRVLPSPPTPPTGPVPVPPEPLPVPPPVLPDTAVAPYSEPPLLLPHGEEKSQADRSSIAAAPVSTERWTSCIAIHPKNTAAESIGRRRELQVMPREKRASLTASHNDSGIRALRAAAGFPAKTNATCPIQMFNRGRLCSMRLHFDPLAVAAAMNITGGR
jgi:hypothetical protein